MHCSYGGWNCQQGKRTNIAESRCACATAGPCCLVSFHRYHHAAAICACLTQLYVALTYRRYAGNEQGPSAVALLAAGRAQTAWKAPGGPYDLHTRPVDAQIAYWYVPKHCASLPCVLYYLDTNAVRFRFCQECLKLVRGASSWCLCLSYL